MEKTRKDAAGKVQFTEVSTEQQNSVELSKNAKGDVAMKIKVYQDDPKKSDATMEAYIRVAQARAEQLKQERHPHDGEKGGSKKW